MPNILRRSTEVCEFPVDESNPTFSHENGGWPQVSVDDALSWLLQEFSLVHGPLAESAHIRDTTAR